MNKRMLQSPRKTIHLNLRKMRKMREWQHLKSVFCFRFVFFSLRWQLFVGGLLISWCVFCFCFLMGFCDEVCCGFSLKFCLFLVLLSFCDFSNSRFFFGTISNSASAFLFFRFVFSFLFGLVLGLGVTGFSNCFFSRPLFSFSDVCGCCISWDFHQAFLFWVKVSFFSFVVCLYVFCFGRFEFFLFRILCMFRILCHIGYLLLSVARDVEVELVAILGLCGECIAFVLIVMCVHFKRCGRLVRLHRSLVLHLLNNSLNCCIVHASNLCWCV